MVMCYDVEAFFPRIQGFWRKISDESIPCLHIFLFKVEISLHVHTKALFQSGSLYGVVPKGLLTFLGFFQAMQSLVLVGLFWTNNEILIKREPLVYIYQSLARCTKKKRKKQARTVQLQSQANPWTVHQQIQPTSHTHTHTHTHIHTHTHTHTTQQVK